MSFCYVNNNILILLGTLYLLVTHFYQTSYGTIVCNIDRWFSVNQVNSGLLRGLTMS